MTEQSAADSLDSDLQALTDRLGRGPLTVDSFRAEDGSLIEDDDFFAWVHLTSVIRVLVAREREADDDIAAGRVTTFDNAEDFLASLGGG